MRYELKKYEDVERGEAPGGLPGTINRVLGKFGMLVVNREKPQILSSTVDPEGAFTIFNYGNPLTGQITHRFAITHGPRISRTMEGSNE